MRDGAFFGLTPRHWRDGPSNWGREFGKLGHTIPLIPTCFPDFEAKLPAYIAGASR